MSYIDKNWLSASLILAVALGCGTPENANAPGLSPEPGNPQRLRIATANQPLKWMAERLAPQAEVVFPVPAGVDPATWQPPAETIAEIYQTADIIALNGAGYDGWTDRATLPLSAIVNTSSQFADRYIVRQGVITHSHGPEGDHSHRETAFTTWLDPQLAILQAEALAEALRRKTPAENAQIDANLAAIEADLRTLDDRLAAAFEGIADQPIIMSHPVYEYLVRRYGLNARSLHWEPGDVPGTAAWHDLDHLLQDHPARWMIWESEPLPETLAGLGERGITAIVFDPAANPVAGDYLAIQTANAERLEAALRAD